MNVSTIVIPKETALERLAEFRNISTNARRVEDVEFRRLFKMAAQYPILDVSQAFRETGLNELGQPRLAMARADWKECHYHRWDRRFSNSARYYKANSFRIPNDAWNWDLAKHQNLFAPVPFVPPAVRNNDEPHLNWILFEVKDWKRYPADPFLLKKISGWLYAVIGEWDLTDLERSLLAGLRQS